MGGLGESIMLNAVIHNFQDQLEYSANLSDESSWVEFYRRLWPDLIAAVRIDKNSKFQQWGIDREVLLPNGKRFSIDEKKRKLDYGDLLLEEWSVCDFDFENKKVIRGIKKGWAIDPEKRCDFIAYAVQSSGKCYLLPFELTRQTCVHNFPRWKQNSSWYPKSAKNNGYTTVNVAVPFTEFRIRLWEQMHRKFGSEIPLPLPSEKTSQLLLFQYGAST